MNCAQLELALWAAAERWLPVVGFEGLYEVSEQGRVRSLDRVVVFVDGRQRRAKGRVLKPGCRGDKHLYVKLPLRTGVIRFLRKPHV